MKRVVVQISPNTNEESVTTKIETILPDDSAQILLSTALSLNDQQSSETSEQVIEFLVRRELASALDSDDDGLFDRLMARVERTLLSLVYAECDHVQTKAAFRLGIDRNTLHKKLSRHNLLNSNNEQRKESA